MQPPTPRLRRFDNARSELETFSEVAAFLEGVAAQKLSSMCDRLLREQRLLDAAVGWEGGDALDSGGGGGSSSSGSSSSSSSSGGGGGIGSQQQTNAEAAADLGVLRNSAGGERDRGDAEGAMNAGGSAPSPMAEGSVDGSSEAAEGATVESATEAKAARKVEFAAYGGPRFQRGVRNTNDIFSQAMQSLLDQLLVSP